MTQYVPVPAGVSADRSLKSHTDLDKIIRDHVTRLVWQNSAAIILKRQQALDYVD